VESVVRRFCSALPLTFVLGRDAIGFLPIDFFAISAIATHVEFSFPCSHSRFKKNPPKKSLGGEKTSGLLGPGCHGGWIRQETPGGPLLRCFHRWAEEQPPIATTVYAMVDCSTEHRAQRNITTFPFLFSFPRGVKRPCFLGKKSMGSTCRTLS
jgi:hypothetical protein